MRIKLVAAVLSVACMAIASAPPASADVPRRSEAYLVISDDGRCLDADTSTPTHNGTKVQVWRCNLRNTNQWWHFYTDGTLRSAHDGRCLDADISSPTRNGTKVQLWNCIRGNLNQVWFPSGAGTIYSAHDGRCLDRDAAAPPRNGAKVQLWRCNGWSNQRWRLVALAEYP